ncbi:putative lipoprotein, partial [Escherichia coli 89.0511]
GCYRRIQS